MQDQIDELVTKLRSLSPKHKAKLVSQFREIAAAVVDFANADEDGSRSIGFSFSMTRSTTNRQTD